MHRSDLSKAILILLFFTFFTLLSVNTAAEDEVLLPEEEAPKALFETNLGDADVDLYLDGTWTIDSSLGAVWGTPGPVSAAVPGFSSGFLFDQIPDLTLSLWLMDRYFFETSLSEDSDYNTYLFGYEGKEGELLQHARLGNTATFIESTPLMEVPDHPAGALGASATMETDISRHELLLRYQKTSRISRTYSGTSEIEELNLDPGEYIRGRYFLLPDEDIENAVVYLEDSDGEYTGDDGSTYREATEYEASVSAEEGFVALTSRPAGRVLVYYTKDSYSVGDSNIGQDALAGLNGSSQPDPSAAEEDFYWTAADYAGIDFDAELQVTVNGTTSLLLWDGGAWSPFEFQAVYSSTGASSGSTVEVELRESGAEEATASLEGEYGSGSLTLIPSGFNRASTRYPLADLIPEAYGPDREALLPWYLWYVQESGTSVISVPSSAIEGTVRVTVNGREEKRFSRLSDGTLEFFFTLYPSDSVEVSYELPDDTASGADLLFISSNSFNPFQRIPDLTLRADLGLRWNVDLDQGYSEEYDQSPGSLLATAGASLEKETAGFTINGGVSLGTHDTRGYLRLAGMDTGATGFSISGHTLFPAAPSASYAAASLGELSYTDYYKYLDTGGSSLQEYTWTPPSDQVYAYGDGNPVGPSVSLAEDDDIDGRVAVLDYSLDDGEWVGAQINAGDTLDLSGAAAVSFRYRLTNTGGGTPALIFRAGAVSEDIDDDGILDNESGAYDTGFDYNIAGDTLYVGGGGNGPRGEYGNGSEETEDADGNDLLNPEVSSRTVTLTPPSGTSVDGVWHTVYIPLSRAERSALSSTRAVQILLENSGVTSSGKLLIGEVQFQGTGFVPVNTNTSVSELSEYELESGEAPTQKLYAAYDLVDTRFNDGNDDQQVMRMEWSGGAAEAAGPLNEVPLSAYDTLRFYYRLEAATGDTEDIQLDIEGDEGTFSISLNTINTSTEWSEVEVDLANRTVSVQGDTPASSTVSGSRDIVVRRARISTSTSDGVLFLDELHLADPVSAADFGVVSSARYSRPGEILSAGGIPLLGNFTWAGSSRIASSGFGTGFSAADGRVYRVYQEAAFSTLWSRADLSLTVREGESGVETAGSHSLTIPENGPVQLNENYSHEPSGSTFSYSRGDALRLSLPGFSAAAGAAVSGDEESLTQTWTAAASADSRFISLSPSLSFSNTLTDTVLDPENYGAGWMNATELLLYREDSTPGSRSVYLDLPLESTPSNDLNLSLASSASSARYGTEERLQLDSMETLFSLEGVLFPMHPYQLKYLLSYNRDFSGEWSTASFNRGEHAFSGDISSWAETAGSQGYFLTSLPGREIFFQSEKDRFTSGTEGFEEAQYSPSLNLSLKRPFSSRFSDLIIPSTLSFSTGRDYLREYDTVSSSFTTATSATMTAVNLTGTMGAYPLVSWYESDEIITSVNVTTLQEEELEVAWSADNTLRLYGHDDGTLSLKNSFSWDSDYNGITWNSSFEMRWFQNVENPLQLPLPINLIPDGDQRLRHTSELEFELSPGDESWERSGSLKQSGALLFGAQSSIEVYAAFGFDSTGMDGYDSSLNFFALEAGITGVFSF